MRAFAKSKVKAVSEFLASPDRVLVCTHATFRFAVDELGVEAFDDCLIAVDEFHHVSAGDDNKLGAQLAALIARDKAHIVAMTGSYFRGDAVPVLSPEDRNRDLHLLRAAQRLRAPEIAGDRLFLLHGLLSRRDHEGAGPGVEDDHPYSERQRA
jgi:hypothetical protein